MNDIVEIIGKLQKKFPHTQIFITPALPRFYHGVADDKYRQRFFKCLSRLQGIINSRRLNFTGNVRLMQIDERIMHLEAELWLHDEYPTKAIHLNANGMSLLKASLEQIRQLF